MVVGDPLCVLNFVSGAMINGVCCYYDLAKEEERRKAQQDAIRQAMRKEWEHHREVEFEERSRASMSKSAQDQRRRKLMGSKIFFQMRSTKDASPTAKPPSPTNVADFMLHESEVEAFATRDKTPIYYTAPSDRSSFSRMPGEVLTRQSSLASSRAMSSLMDSDSDLELEDILLE